MGLLAAGRGTNSAYAQLSGPPTEAATASYEGQPFPRQRTPVAELPLEGQAEILRLETLLQQAYVALTSSPTASVFPFWRADAVEQAAHQAAAVVPTWNQAAYQREAAFYTAEEARRYPAPADPRSAAPAAPPAGKPH